MSVHIIFESHATTIDNEAEKASGWNDVELSDLGIKQAGELGERRGDDGLDAIFCSDSQRSYRTAWIAMDIANCAYGEESMAMKGYFGSQIPVFIDWRLRECNYGEFTQKPSVEVSLMKSNRITEPFPGGESYEQTTARMKEFLEDLLKFHNGKRVMVVGHRATQYALEHLILGKPLDEVVPAPWSWQPGWQYELTSLL